MFQFFERRRVTAPFGPTLVVEDDSATSEFIMQALAKHGLEAARAATVAEALVKLESEPLPSAIILDLRMPDASGTLILRRIHRDGLPIRVAVVSGADPADFRELMRFPPDAFFSKPVIVRQLLDWLQEART